MSPGTGTGDATSEIRDLVARLRTSPRAERREVVSLLERPTERGSLFAYGGEDETELHCTDTMCFHWTATGDDAPPAEDADLNAIPDFVDEMIGVFGESWTAEVDTFGFLAPLPDDNAPEGGPDARLDVYIEDTSYLGSPGVVLPAKPFARSGATPAYVLMDNDLAEYLPRFGPRSLFLRAVVSHEFFHVVQGAYDFFEDAWFAEGTAVWMEEEVYDETDYMVRLRLERSALTNPRAPIDYGSEGFQYGSGLFWRYLSERFGTAGGRDQSLLKETWERAADEGTRRPYSLKALAGALRSRDVSLRDAFVDFGTGNFFPELSYAEGVDYLEEYGRPPASRTTVTRKRPRATRKVRLAHLSNRYVIHRPGSSVAADARLRLSVDAPSRVRGGEASAMIWYSSGEVEARRVPLGSDGDGRLRVPFGRDDVRMVVAVLTNASARFEECRSGFPFSCSGLSKDDNLKFRLSSNLVQ